MKRLILFLISFLLLSYLSITSACTEVMMHHDKNYIVGRNFDWYSGAGYVVINPIGQQHHSINTLKNETSLQWRSRYGSVTFNVPDKTGNKPNLAVAVGGINQQGLVASVLWLDSTQYARPKPHQHTLDAPTWAQYVLDNFATVNQAVRHLKQLNVVPMSYQGRRTLLQLVIHDTSGNTAIVEYLKGHLVIFQGKHSIDRMLTNTRFKEALKRLKQYKLSHDGLNNLPSGYSSEARFIRAACYIKKMPSFSADQQAITYTFDALKDVAEPTSSSTPTQWSIVYDLSSRQIFYKTVKNHNLRIINFNQINFSKDMPVRYLNINSAKTGMVLADFKTYKNK